MVTVTLRKIKEKNFAIDQVINTTLGNLHSGGISINIKQIVWVHDKINSMLDSTYEKFPCQGFFDKASSKRKYRRYLIVITTIIVF